MEYETAATNTLYGRLLQDRDAAQERFERWRDGDLDLSDEDFNARLVVLAKARDEINEKLNALRLRLRLPAKVVALSDLEWNERRQTTDAYLHAVFVTRGKRGPRPDTSRVQICWADAEDLPKLPYAGSGPLPPYKW